MNQEQQTPKWLKEFDQRQQQLIQNCITYAESNPSGLPGHQLMLIIWKMVILLNRAEQS